MRLAVNDCDTVSPDDVELLDDVLRYGSTTAVAHLRHTSQSAVSQRLSAIMDSLESGIRRWENVAESSLVQQVGALKQVIATSEAARNSAEQQLGAANSRIAELEEKIARLTEHNRQMALSSARNTREIRDELRREKPTWSKYKQRH